MSKSFFRPIILSIFLLCSFADNCFSSDDEINPYSAQKSLKSGGVGSARSAFDESSAVGAIKESVQPKYPGDWSGPGGRLVSGREKFINGGASCMSCHSVRGHLLMPSLAKVAHKKTGDELTLFLLKPGNLSMKMAYGKHPLTVKEAKAIGDYFATIGRTSDKKIGHEQEIPE